MNGSIIVLEGLDDVGKSYLLDKLVSYYSTAFEIETWGDYYKDCDIRANQFIRSGFSLAESYIKSFREQLNKMSNNSLKIFDRYWYSTYAYQKDNNVLKYVHKYNLPKPDICIWINKEVARYDSFRDKCRLQSIHSRYEELHKFCTEMVKYDSGYGYLSLDRALEMIKGRIGI